MRIGRRAAGVAVALVVFLALIPLGAAPECRSYGVDVTGCGALARSLLQVRVWDGPVGIAIAVVAAGAASLLAFAAGVVRARLRRGRD